MRYIVGPDGALLQQRDNCPQTCNSSATGNGQGSVCRCCEALETGNCYWFTGSMDCPKHHPPPPLPPPPQYCVTRTIIRNSGKYTVNSNGSVTRVCN